PAYFATLPLGAMLEALVAEGVPAYVSNTAGTYLCNQTLYGTLHRLAERGHPARAGFIHLPLLPAMVAASGLEQPSMDEARTVRERVPFLVMALLAFFSAERWPGLTLGLVLVMLLVITGVGGFLMPAWMDLIARALPTTIRGRFFALSNFVAGLVGFGASLVIAEVLARLPAPAS